MLHTNTQNHNPHPIEIKTQVPLRDKNWFNTGGPARYYCEPTTDIQFQHALEYAQTNGLNIFVLGQGANILISDDGFDGLVIRPHNKNLEIAATHETEALVTIGAGACLDHCIEWCLNNNISGLEEFSGIPGTIGGAVFINIHYFQFLLSDFLASARVINKQSGAIETVDGNWFNFGYDASKLFEQTYYLLDATFKFKRITDTEVAYARGRKLEIIRHRKARYPYQGTCGSFFRNFHEHEVTLELQNKKIIFVAYYLDKIGIKGALSYGDAAVSHKHANMIVNNGNATSTDVVNVARDMQDKVYKKFGIMPQPECQLIGFKNYPLL